MLRAGGRLVVLEFDRPRVAPIAWAHAFYTRVVMPRTATLLSGDRSGAYHYLPRSVETFLDAPAMERRIAEAGFARVTSRPLTLGTCRIFRAEAR